MQVLTLSSSVRIRVAQGSGVFVNPFNMTIIDNSEGAKDGKGSWMTLDEGTQFSIVGAYDKSDTFFLVVDANGLGLDSDDAFGLVVRGLSMQNLLEVAFQEEEVSTALTTTGPTAMVAVA
jgi:hypothetical protein